MARIFNNREGFDPEDDRLFRRLHEPIPEGPLKGQRIDPDRMKKAIQFYYEMMGWDEQGRPLPAKLHDLSLGWLMETESDG
jgi:aldehyde:ferredoxin oxidoreductase